jgi:IclR family pca regulon transcriptional regulator
MGRVLLAGAEPAWLEEYLSNVELVATTPYTITSVDRLADVLDEVRTKGFALVDQELEIGLRSLAVPIHDPSGRVVAAVNTSMQVALDDAHERAAELLPILRATADAIEADLALNP